MPGLEKRRFHSFSRYAGAFVSAIVPQEITNPTPPEGLSAAEVERRRRAGDSNKVVRRTGRSVADIIRSNVFTRINAMLGVLLALVLSTGKWVNAAFGILIVANSIIGIVQELRAKHTLDNLTIIGETKPRVVRDGAVVEIAQDELVRGDLIQLGQGDQLVVDGVLVEGDHLHVDESMLTGESDAVAKEVGDSVYSGSFVASGAGIMQATAIGAEAYSAQLIAEAGAFTLSGSQLQRGINQILRVITWLLVPVGILTIYTQIVRSGADTTEAINAMVAALVPMIPEGLVLMASIAFAVGVVRLGHRKALVNQLDAIEMLARVDVVCADKTGTLTENAMELDRVEWLGEPRPQVLRAIAVGEKNPNDTMVAIAQGLDSTAATAAVEGTNPGEGEGMQLPELVDHIPFDSHRKFSAWDFGPLPGHSGCFALGAPDILAPDTKQASEIAAAGLRVLALVSVPSLQAVEEGTGERVVEALVVLRQKVRPDAADTVAYCTAEGMSVKVISGDNAASVAAVARSVGVPGAERAVDARSLPAADGDAAAVAGSRRAAKRRRSVPAADSAPGSFGQQVEQGVVFGRVRPDQKRDMVAALQGNGHTVAMTGDGVNDVLALKQADIGVAMGSGSPASRSVAQVVLLDNAFATLPAVVAEGRRVIGNIERVAELFLTKTVYSVILALIIGISGVVYPFQPIHVTVVGWFTIGIPAFVLSLAPNKERAQPGFASRVLRTAVPAGVVIGVFVVLLWLLLYPGPHVSDALMTEVSTATLASLIVMALWVLARVARPWQWWKVLLLVVSASAYALIFLVEPIAELLLVHSVNYQLTGLGVLWGVFGAAAVEAAIWATGEVGRWRRARKKGVEGRRSER